MDLHENLYYKPGPLIEGARVPVLILNFLMSTCHKRSFLFLSLLYASLNDKPLLNKAAR